MHARRPQLLESLAREWRARAQLKAKAKVQQRLWNQDDAANSSPTSPTSTSTSNSASTSTSTSTSEPKSPPAFANAETPPPSPSPSPPSPSPSKSAPPFALPALEFPRDPSSILKRPNPSSILRRPIADISRRPPPPPTPPPPPPELIIKKVAWGEPPSDRRLSPYDGEKRLSPYDDKVLRQWLEANVPPKPNSINPLDDLQVQVQVLYGGRSVLALSSASRSLVESDFYRLDAQGRHVDGWALSIYKVVQTRSPLTHEPMGEYYVFFHNSSAALDYRKDVLQRHNMAAEEQRTEHRPPKVAQYTLLPHSAPPKLELYASQFLQKMLLSKGNKDKGEIALADKHALLLEHLRMKSKHGDQKRVLVHVESGTLTTQVLRAAIDADGEARNLAWELMPPEGETDVASIQPLEHTRHEAKFSVQNEYTAEVEAAAAARAARAAAAVGQEADAIVTQRQLQQADDGTIVGNAYTRFLLSFKSLSESRRFARDWHKREILDRRTERMVTMNVTALW
ncbi:hypothetical protein B0T26DRAFT_872502 [Lasiosphaeria miniovina]|uniref:Uncharacterized protein n=1 Tax=Lasiosphaeria miniovina TaxID=1954250 RepID=A0AA40ALX2_9PEZI|nr:uncharacterized protein B0T26DRAFT_872502 [Lasiosphaeria miniovina]KAK0718270.1 hypothetical protein B0T26DRAFT_872502 [Lasiosphaeria miniovina]